MAKGRMLLKRIVYSEKLPQLSCDAARLLYTWLLSHLDINGCYYASPAVIKGTIFPMYEKVTVKKIAAYLDEMEAVGLIVRYDGGRYLKYPDFLDKQPSLDPKKEGKTDIPPPTAKLLRSNCEVTAPQYKIKEDKIREDSCEQFFTCTYFSVTKERADKYVSAYGLDQQQFLNELKKMALWLDHNPKKRKKNYGKFITNWLGRSKGNGYAMRPLPGTNGDVGNAGIKRMLDNVRMRRAQLQNAQQGVAGVGHEGDKCGIAVGDKGSETACEEIPNTKK